METVTKSIEDNLASLHQILTENIKFKIKVVYKKSTEAFTKGIDKFVKIIIVVAMIVGGVGIMNIMYVSVMERNKEIGIRRALGTKAKIYSIPVLSRISVYHFIWWYFRCYSWICSHYLFQKILCHLDLYQALIVSYML